MHFFAEKPHKESFYVGQRANFINISLGPSVQLVSAISNAFSTTKYGRKKIRKGTKGGLAKIIPNINHIYVHMKAKVTC